MICLLAEGRYQDISSKASAPLSLPKASFLRCQESGERSGAPARSDREARYFASSDFQKHVAEGTSLARFDPNAGGRMPASSATYLLRNGNRPSVGEGSTLCSGQWPTAVHHLHGNRTHGQHGNAHLGSAPFASGGCGFERPPYHRPGRKAP